MYDKIKLENVNIYDLDNNAVNNIITKVSSEYLYTMFTNTTQRDIRNDVQKAINEYCKPQRREQKIGSVINKDYKIKDNIVNLEVSITAKS